MSIEANPKPVCGQCGKPAVVEVSGTYLCVRCEYEFQMSRYMVFAQAVTMMNAAQDDIEAIVGFGDRQRRIPIPNPPIPPINYNNQNVTVTGGTVGAINFGTVNDIQVNIQTMTKNGDVEIADKLLDLTNAILNAKDATQEAKNELLDQVAFLTAQANTPPAERKLGLIKAAVAGVKEGAAVIASAAGAWTAAEPIIKGFFGHS